MFVGRCRDESNKFNLIKTIFALSSVVMCKENCHSISDCTAFDYSSEGDCNLYRGGPYTQSDGISNIDCYLLTGIVVGYAITENK